MPITKCFLARFWRSIELIEFLIPVYMTDITETHEDVCVTKANK